VTENSRRAYLGLSKLFLAVGGVAAVMGAADRVLGLEIFRGSPVGTSLFLLVVGGLLHWTATTAKASGEVQDEADRDRSP
jgi:hypothetical protein